MTNIASKQIIPAVIKYVTKLAGSINTITAAAPVDVSVQQELLEKCSALLAETKRSLEELRKLAEQGSSMEEGREQAEFYYHQVIPAMEALRTPVDNLEMLVDKSMWPMPSYGDLLFEV